MLSITILSFSSPQPAFGSQALEKMLCSLLYKIFGYTPNILSLF